MMNHMEPFVLYEERRLVLLIGPRARDLQQLLEQMRDVPCSAIFHHTHHTFLSHHYETPSLPTISPGGSPRRRR